MNATPTTVTQTAPADPAPTSSRKYRPAIWARLAITMMSAAMIPQPPSQPVRGPQALVRRSSRLRDNESGHGVYRLPPGAGCWALAILYLYTILLYRFLIRKFAERYGVHRRTA